MTNVIRKTFHILIPAILLGSLLSACASGSKGNYCDMVVENEADATEAQDVQTSQKSETESKPKIKK